MIKVAIQGIKGSYHHHVASDYFSDSSEIIEYFSFDELIQSVVHNICDYGVLAIENSIAGSIIPNYSLMDNSNLQIVGEYYININHQLLALNGKKIDDIEVISSHPMALLQCKDFLKKHPRITIIEAKDTANVAKEIKNNNIENMAAIASLEASKLYDLSVIKKNIQNNKNNETRFVIVSKKIVSSQIKCDKASLKLVLSHKTGSLAKILNILSKHGLNLTKIQSLPIAEITWKYSFFIDTTFEKLDDLKKALKKIEIFADSVKVLGIYEKRML